MAGDFIQKLNFQLCLGRWPYTTCNFGIGWNQQSDEGMGSSGVNPPGSHPQNFAQMVLPKKRQPQIWMLLIIFSYIFSYFLGIARTTGLRPHFPKQSWWFGCEVHRFLAPALYPAVPWWLLATQDGLTYKPYNRESRGNLVFSCIFFDALQKANLCMKSLPQKTSSVACDWLQSYEHLGYQKPKPNIYHKYSVFRNSLYHTRLTKSLSLTS